MTIFQTPSIMMRVKRLPRTRLCRHAILAAAAIGGLAGWIALATGHAGWLLPIAAGLFVAAGACILSDASH